MNTYIWIMKLFTFYLSTLFIIKLVLTCASLYKPTVQRLLTFKCKQEIMCTEIGNFHKKINI